MNKEEDASWTVLKYLETHPKEKRAEIEELKKKTRMTDSEFCDFMSLPIISKPKPMPIIINDHSTKNVVAGLSSSTIKSTDDASKNPDLKRAASDTSEVKVNQWEGVHKTKKPKLESSTTTPSATFKSASQWDEEELNRKAVAEKNHSVIIESYLNQIKTDLKIEETKKKIDKAAVATEASGIVSFVIDRQPDPVIISQIQNDELEETIMEDVSMPSTNHQTKVAGPRVPRQNSKNMSNPLHREDEQELRPEKAKDAPPPPDPFELARIQARIEKHEELLEKIHLAVENTRKADPSLQWENEKDDKNYAEAIRAYKKEMKEDSEMKRLAESQPSPRMSLVLGKLKETRALQKGQTTNMRKTNIPPT